MLTIEDVGHRRAKAPRHSTETERAQEPRRRGTIADYVRPESLAAYHALSRAQFPPHIPAHAHLSNADYKHAVTNNRERDRMARIFARRVIAAVRLIAPATSPRLTAIRDELTAYLRPENGGGSDARREKANRIGFVLDTACKIVDGEPMHLGGIEIVQLDGIVGRLMETVREKDPKPAPCDCGAVVKIDAELDIVGDRLYRDGWRYCLVGDYEDLHCPECIAAYVAGETVPIEAAANETASHALCGAAAFAGPAPTDAAGSD